MRRTGQKMGQRAVSQGVGRFCAYLVVWDNNGGGISRHKATAGFSTLACKWQNSNSQ